MKTLAKRLTSRKTWDGRIPLDKYDSFEDVDPNLIDESEAEALDFIKENGYAVRMHGEWW